MTAKPLPLEHLFKHLPLLRDLPPNVRPQLMATARVIDCPAGHFVFRQGDRDRYAYFLLKGVLQMYACDQLVQEVVSGTEAASRPLAHLQPRQMSARARTPASLLRVDRDLLERVIAVSAAPPAGRDLEVRELGEEESEDWMTRLLRSELFSHLPVANIQRIFAQAECFEAEAGELIINQGGPGDYYYIVREGRCEVVRRTSLGGPPVRLAVLCAGDTFGEEALIADARRNATVAMLAHGELMRLSREDFIELIKKPLLRSVTFAEARKMAAAGAVMLDVRYADEYARDAFAGSENIPVNLLRVQVQRLDAGRRYVVLCDNGARSAIGAFILVGRGFDAVYVEGGLSAGAVEPAHPTPAANVVHFPPPVQGPIPVSHLCEAERSGRPDTPAPAAAALEADVRASALKAELAKANLQIEQALLLKKEAEAARRAAEEQAERRLRAERERLETEARTTAATLEETRRLKEQAEAARHAAEAQAEQRLRAERERLEADARKAAATLEETLRLKEDLEAAKRAAEMEVERQRRQEQENIRRVQEEADRRLQEERRKLERAYAWKEEELARALKSREEAETRLAAERKHLAGQAREAKRRLDEARRVQREIEEMRQAAAVEAEERLQRQRQLEERLRTEIQTKVADERRRLEAEFVKNAQLLAVAQRDREVAEAARRAAGEEAERIIAEYKAAHQQLHAEAQQQLHAERERLEAEARRIEAALEEACNTKAQAEAARRAAEEQMACLRTLERETAAGDTQLKAQLRSGIASYQAELERANRDLDEAEHAAQLAQVAQAANSENLARQRGEEESLLAEIQRDVEKWLSEQETMENSEAHQEVLAYQREQSERIRLRAEAARQAAKEHDQRLLDELASRLDDLDDP